MRLGQTEGDRICRQSSQYDVAPVEVSMFEGVRALGFGESERDLPQDARRLSPAGDPEVLEISAAVGQT